MSRKRKRQKKGYGAVPGEEGADDDVELGETAAPQASGVAPAGDAPDAQKATTLEEEVDNWDENAIDAWDEDDMGDVGASTAGKAAEAVENGDAGDTKK